VTENCLERVPEWQKHYKGRLRLLLETCKENKKDNKNPRVLIELRKSDVILDIVAFIGREIITMDELDGFSEELIEAVWLILKK
jgi:hypothetical protein